MSLPEDGMLWQLLKAYANEDWDQRDAPWPAPAEAFLADASKAEAAALADELATIEALNLGPDGWRALLTAAHVAPEDIGAKGDVVAWAKDLRARAESAASR